MKVSPIEVPGYIIPYITKECAGIFTEGAGENFTEIRIEPTSVFGMFLTRTLRPDYKVKFYQLTIYSRKIGNKTAFSTDILEFKNNAEFQIDLSFEDLENFYRFLDTLFNTSFYFFMSGFCYGCDDKKKIKNGINTFIDKYDLLEYGFNENQMRILYWRYRNNGSVSAFRNNKSFKFFTSGKF